MDNATNQATPTLPTSEAVSVPNNGANPNPSLKSRLMQNIEDAADKVKSIDFKNPQLYKTIGLTTLKAGFWLLKESAIICKNAGMYVLSIGNNDVRSAQKKSEKDLELLRKQWSEADLSDSSKTTNFLEKYKKYASLFSETKQYAERKHAQNKEKLFGNGKYAVLSGFLAVALPIIPFVGVFAAVVATAATAFYAVKCVNNLREVIITNKDLSRIENTEQQFTQLHNSIIALRDSQKENEGASLGQSKSPSADFSTAAPKPAVQAPSPAAINAPQAPTVTASAPSPQRKP